jgi:hypothetical protein
VVPPARYTRPGGVGATVADQVADDRVLALFLDGHTIVLQGLHRLWPPLVDFAGALGADLGHPVQINAYITPSSSQGFGAHYDVHDVFVLQVAGEKRWRIHEPVLVAPTRDDVWTDRRDEVASRASQEPVVDAVLRPGDALYLPRGFLHAAEALGGISCHLTVGVHPVTRETLLRSVLGAATADERLRRSLPMGVDLTDPAVLADELQETVAALTSVLCGIEPATVAADIARRLADSSRPGPVAPLATSEQLPDIGPDSVVAPRPFLRVVGIDDEGEALVVRLAGRDVRLPAASGKAVRSLLTGPPTRVADLPDLAPEAAVAVARSLVGEAVAVVLDTR